jgi:hypothetical protein
MMSASRHDDSATIITAMPLKPLRRRCRQLVTAAADIISAYYTPDYCRLFSSLPDFIFRLILAAFAAADTPGLFRRGALKMDTPLRQHYFISFHTLTPFDTSFGIS